MRVYVLNTGGTLGMVGNPLRPAKSAAELLDGVNLPDGIETSLVDFPVRQDSTNVNHADRVSMARMILDVYGEHDAFVILHGTDTLAETCAFLAMMFKQSLQKPLFVIGAQMTKDEAGTDVPMQIANTMRVANAFVRNDVVGVFNVCIGEVLDGARVRKRNEADFAAFYTPGRQPVAKAWPHIEIMSHARRKDPVLAVQGLRTDAEYEPNVMTLSVSADTPPYVLVSLIDQTSLKGVIIECKGAGNVPDRKWTMVDDEISWIDAIQIATDNGIHVGILSPFDDGRVVLDRYELGALAKAAGALSLESLTPAMADAKFRMAIARHGDKPQRIQELLSTNIVGELLDGIADEG